jgi:hypothetical protein
MRAYVENLSDWSSRLARLELQIALSERTGEINWHLRIRARVLRYLLSRYSEPAWEPSWPLLVENASLRAVTQPPDTAASPDEDDAAASLRAIAGVHEGANALPQLTWRDVCYCLLPWDQPFGPPGSPDFENPPRPAEVLADRLRNIQALNSAPARRRWFNWRK